MYFHSLNVRRKIRAKCSVRTGNLKDNCNQVTEMMGLCPQIRLNPYGIYQHGEFPQIHLGTSQAFCYLLTWQLPPILVAVKIGQIQGYGLAVGFTQEIIHCSMYMLFSYNFAVQEYYEWRRKPLFFFYPVFPQENIQLLCGVYIQTRHLVLMLNNFQKCQVMIRSIFLFCTEVAPLIGSPPRI